MLKVHPSCAEHLDATKKFAQENGLIDQLQRQLDYLDAYGGLHGDPAKIDRTATECQLFRDFAPHSFTFVIRGKDDQGQYTRCWFNGGLIFHSAGDGGAAMPTLAVRVGSATKAEWLIHT